jgi:hypothetical protein
MFVELDTEDKSHAGRHVAVELSENTARILVTPEVSKEGNRLRREHLLNMSCISKADDRSKSGTVCIVMQSCKNPLNKVTFCVLKRGIVLRDWHE